MMRSIFVILGAVVLATSLPVTASVAAPTPVGGDGDAAKKPITKIAGKMSGVLEKLTKEETGEPVQTRQQTVVRDLDKLIAELEKECAACRGNKSKNNPTRPLNDSRIMGGTGGIGDLTNPGDSEKDWAKLSPRERDRILQSMSEGFPPEYRTVLERYYRRLAEEKSAKAGAEPRAAEGEVDAPAESEPAPAQPEKP
jgi:hypothetical protein